MSFLRRRPEVLLIAVTFLWGSTFAVTKDVVRAAPPLPYLSLRFSFAALLLFLLHPQALRPRRALWRDGLILGTLQAFGLVLQVLGQVYTTASKAAFVTALATTLTPLVAFLRDGDRPGRPQLLAVGLATLGLYFLTYPVDGATWNRGDLYTALCALIYSGAIVETARRAPRHPAGDLTAMQTGIAAAFFLLFLGTARLTLACLPPEPSFQIPAILELERRPVAFDLRFVLQLSYMSIVCTVITFLGQTWAMSRLSATHAAVVFALEPVFATALAIVLLGPSEWPGTRGAWGALLVLSGVLVSELPRRPRIETRAGIQPVSDRD
ncbi:MAG TPA: DMT family transporter [Polyangia bacterium]|jgi:drug/metabolite transporter (DMT)-like permease|nr:DMT family transporter [Polyangia bacterium]